MEREEADLYGLPLEEFIPARTALEKRLRKEGERERAAAVKKLPKPSVAAWGLNQASRSQPQARRDLLDASADLREVQERLIAGGASAADLEAATARQRSAIDSLVDAAAGLLTSDGKSLGDATLARIRETLAAVASDEELAALVDAGTVDRERRSSGLGFPFATTAPAPSAAPARKGSTEGRGPGGGGKSAGRSAKPAQSRGSGQPRGSAEAAPSPAERKRLEKEAQRRERELEAAREAIKAAKAEEKEAARRRKAAERAAKQAAKELERAERAAERARATAEAAHAELEAAAAAVDEAATAREAAEAALDALD